MSGPFVVHAANGSFSLRNTPPEKEAAQPLKSLYRVRTPDLAGRQTERHSKFKNVEQSRLGFSGPTAGSVSRQCRTMLTSGAQDQVKFCDGSTISGAQG